MYEYDDDNRYEYDHKDKKKDVKKRQENHVCQQKL